MWRAAIEAVRPSSCLPGHWPPAPAGRLAVIACGKAAAGTAAQAAAHYGNHCEGIIILPASQEQAALSAFRRFPASHPVPDESSVAAARAALALAGGLTRADLLLVLLSGGGSSLMCLPVAGVTLADKQSLSRALLASGATIQEINCVRKHLSAIKGGRLAQASAAPVFTLAISDVPGDDPGTIASGPTVPDDSTLAEARAVLDRYRIEAPLTIRAALADPANESPRWEAGTEPCRFRIVASGMTALQAAADWCHNHGIEPLVLGDHLQGEASVLARSHAEQALHLPKSVRPACLLSGGETSVALGPECGKGGRNSEYALALAIALAGHPDIWALAADTDGVDGCGGHSGALVDPRTLARAQRAGLQPGDCLRRHDSASFFARAGGLLVEGATGTNVNDFRAILVRT
jgi:hydroxypyruvate reductase